MNRTKILIVDDEPINIKIVAQALQNRYDIMVAKSGEMALEILKKEVPDLILLDIFMPEMDGFEVSKRIKDDITICNIPLIFLTADKSEKTILEAFKCGAVDYITKPFQNEELNIRIDNHIHIFLLQKKLRKAFLNNIKLLKTIDSFVPFIRVDKSGNIYEASSNFCEEFKCTEDEILHENINILKSGNTPTEQYKELWETLLSNKTYSFEIEDINFEYGTNWYHATISPEYDEYENLLGYVAFYKNIDEKIIFKQQSETDNLTQLANRNKLDTILAFETHHSNRIQKSFSMILVDIDDFKKVNDEYGHHIGDLVLQEFATILSKNIRKTDYVGRWGGEEFLIICPQTNSDEAYIVAESLREKIDTKIFSLVGHKTASFGIAEYKFKDKVGDFFKRVDSALYLAKETGKNNVKVHIP